MSMVRDIIDSPEGLALRRAADAYPRLLAAAKQILACVPELYGDCIKDEQITLTLPVEAIETLMVAMEKANG